MSPRGRGLRRDEGGQLMLLAGIVITIAFLLTSLTLSQVASLERQAAAEKPTSLSAEWRFLHDRLQANFESAVPADLSLTTFKSTTFPTISATFRNIQAEKGYDVVIRLADSPLAYNKTEADLLDGLTYDAWSYDGQFYFDQTLDPLRLGVNPPTDGVVYYDECPDETYVGGCIVGILVFIHITDATSSMSEVVLFSVNRGD